ncbi:restriction endonuclease subunit S [Dyadobacter sp. 32]|uniref:restriction endonuclease subunit S n=1 Tax=Dyadobacter sp. 32 TaxID=538966 RepID=UPI0011ED6B19
MARGRRRQESNRLLNWNQLFNENAGRYLEIIISKLSKSETVARESGLDLLEQIRIDKGKSKKGLGIAIAQEEIPYPIPKNWVWCRLGEVIEFTDNLNIETKLPKDTLVNYVDIDAIDNKNFVIRESKLRPVSELSSRARRVMKKGYIAYSLVRPYLNNIAIIEDEKTNYIGSTGLAVFNGIRVDNEFIKYFLLSGYVRNLYLSLFSGFNSPSITQEQFNSTLFPLPPISEQRKIVEFLIDFYSESLKDEGYYFDSHVEHDIVELSRSQLNIIQLSTELNHQLNLVKQLRQSFLREAMQGKLTGTQAGSEENQETGQQLLEKIKAEKAQLIKDKKLKKEKELPPIKPEEIPFEIPEDWVWCRLGEVAYITSGSTPSQDAFVETGIPYLKMYNLKNQKIDFYFKPQYIKEEVHNGQLKRCRAYPGDVLMNIVGPPLGKIAIVPEHLKECNFNQAAVLIRPFYSVMNNFIFWYLNEMSEINSIDTKGVAGQANISVTQAQNMRIPIPSLLIQQSIANKLAETMDNCDKLEASIKQSQQQNEQLLQQVLREALEVEEVDHQA